MSRLQEKVMSDSNASAMINGKPITSNQQGGAAAGGAMGGSCPKTTGSMGSDAANEIRNAVADQKRRADEAKLESEK